jgi:diaminopropionate ammonia-lyase
MPRLFYNPDVSPTLEELPVSLAPLHFHRRLPGYAPTPLYDVPVLASRLGVGRVWVKDESSRFGLPAFKMLGASWATYKALAERLGENVEPWRDLDELKARLAVLRPLTLATATDGNHGRAVARMAALLGFSAHVFVPAGTAQARIEAIRDEGAKVTIIDGSYDDAVRRAASESCLVVSDTSWPGYERVPRWVIEGYATIFWELEDELTKRGEAGPDLVAVQVGVGALAAAVVAHYRRADRAPPKIIGVEPTRAACALASLEAGKPVTVPGPHDSIMAGLNCGTPSLVAWLLLARGIDLFVAVEDERAREAMRLLASAGIVAGESGAAGLAGLLEALSGEQADAARSFLKVDDSTRVLLLVTEGDTDPEAYVRIVSKSAEEVREPLAVSD